MAFDMAKFLARFVEEAREHVEKLNNGFVHLEKNPDDAENINAIFRSAHTIKGSSRMMKLTAITEVAHKLEDALGALRDKKINHSRGLADLLFKAVDTIADMIDKTAAGQEITADNSKLCEDLAKAAEGAVPAAAQPAATAEAKTAAPAEETAKAKDAPAVIPAAQAEGPTPEVGAQAEKKPDAKETRIKTSETVRINSEKLDELIKLMGEMVSNQNRLKQRLYDVKEIERTGDTFFKILSSLNPGAADNPGEDGDFRHGELVDGAQALQQKIRQLVSNIKDDANIHELLTGELQERALKMRMVPLSTVFDSLHRMVRDISRSLGKEVDFSVEGGDIELDKKMMDKIGDPLVHMLRNSVDHGIEAPADRLAAGKHEGGKVRLSACYDAGSILIELSDDGGGIPLSRIREKALRKKMYTEEELEGMPEERLVDLIFHPGFSTSTIITDVSGRGVGMDVVKRNIVEDLRGSLRVDTVAGKGTTFHIRLPLTLAVMRVLLVTIGEIVFAVTAHYVSEIIRVAMPELINVVDRKAVRLRNEFIPVVNMESLLGLPKDETEKDNLLIIIVYAGSEKVGLVVDSLIDEVDMVIKSLPPHMKNIQLVSGVTISGRNEIIDVLHIPAVIDAARRMNGERPAGIAGEERAAVNILVVDDSVNTREIEKSILEAYGYRVELAGDGMAGFEKAREQRFDLVITDVEMPRLDGFSLTERLRKEEAYRDTPIIIVTSREKEEDKRRGIAVGADAYIIKGSFDQTNLLDTVRNLVG